MHIYKHVQILHSAILKWDQQPWELTELLHITEREALVYLLSVLTQYSISKDRTNQHDTLCISDNYLKQLCLIDLQIIVLVCIFCQFTCFTIPELYAHKMPFTCIPRNNTFFRQALCSPVKRTGTPTEVTFHKATAVLRSLHLLVILVQGFLQHDFVHCLYSLALLSTEVLMHRSCAWKWMVRECFTYSQDTVVFLNPSDNVFNGTA